LVGESVDELRDRAGALRDKRDALRKKFEAAYRELKNSLRAKVSENNPDRLRQFFFTNRSTAVGPAAAFFAADMYYEKKQTKPAVRLYEDLVAQFPDSPYTEKARKRLADIELRYPYDMYDKPKYHPYKVPDSLDVGGW
jgi:predicted negative regulator of RcsB-dependent stress response